MVSLSYFSGYIIPVTSQPVPFNPGALFLTPIGLILHSFLSDAETFSLYFKESVREGIYSNLGLLGLMIINSLIAWRGLIRMSL